MKQDYQGKKYHMCHCTPIRGVNASRKKKAWRIDIFLGLKADSIAAHTHSKISVI